MKDPDYRYQSADEMRADIEAALDGRPVGATAAMGAVPYGYGDQPTTMLRPAEPQTTAMPPVAPDDDYDDGGDRRGRRHTSTILLVLAAILVLVGAVFIGRALFASDPPASQTEVPDVSGQEVEDATNELVNSGFEVAEGDSVPCADIEEGLVCRTDPEAGETIARGETVTLLISEGPEAVEVPDVVGDSFEDAEAELEEAGFEVARENQETDEAEPDTVLEQSPAAGEEAEPGTEITLTVAIAPETVEVPDVVGQDYDAAVDILAEAGFTATRVDQTDTSRPENQVIAQNPTAGTGVPEPGVVELTVAVPPEQPNEVTVPDVTNQTLEQARAAIEGAGLTVAVEGPDIPTAIVMTTNPGPNQSVEPNTTVTVYVYDPAAIGGQDGGNGNGGPGGGPGGAIGGNEGAIFGRGS